MALTESERQRVLIHLGYPGTPGGVLVAGGLSWPSQRSNVAEYQMERLTGDGVDRVKTILDVMDGIEERLARAQSRLAVESVGAIAIRQDEMQALEGETARWRKKLALTIGCYESKEVSGGNNGINISRRGI